MNEISTLTEKLEKLMRAKTLLKWFVVITTILIFIALILYYSATDPAASQGLLISAIVLAGGTAILALLVAMLAGSEKKARAELIQAQSQFSAFVVNLRKSNEFDQLTVVLNGKQGEAGSDDLFLWHQAATGKQKIEITGTWTGGGKTYQGTGVVNVVGDRVGSLTISLLDEPDGASDKVHSGDIDGSLTISLLDDPDGGGGKVKSGELDGSLTISLLDDPDRVMNPDAGKVEVNEDDEFDGETKPEPTRDWDSDVENGAENEFTVPPHESDKG